MKKIIITLAVLMIAVNGFSGNFSAGVFLGYPNALSLRLDLSEGSAVDGYIGWDWSGLYAAGDFVLKRDLVLEGLTLKLFYGAGALLTIHSYTTYEWTGTSWHWVDKTDIGVGLRGKIGVSYFLPDMPIELFIEIGPGVTFVPSFQITGIGGAGVRYRF